MGVGDTGSRCALQGGSLPRRRLSGRGQRCAGTLAVEVDEKVGRARAAGSLWKDDAGEIELVAIPQERQLISVQGCGREDRMSIRSERHDGCPDPWQGDKHHLPGSITAALVKRCRGGGDGCRGRRPGMGAGSCKDAGQGKGDREAGGYDRGVTETTEWQRHTAPMEGITNVPC